MSDLPVRSPSAKVGGIVYFGRMLDKIGAHRRGELPTEYQPNLGKGFDARCTAFLGVDYSQLIEFGSGGQTDEEVLHWCFTHGVRPSEAEIQVWNEFMRKCGWNDDITETLERRKRESGLAERSDIQTMFEYIDADEGRACD